MQCPYSGRFLFPTSSIFSSPMRRHLEHCDVDNGFAAPEPGSYTLPTFPLNYTVQQNCQTLENMSSDIIHMELFLTALLRLSLRKRSASRSCSRGLRIPCSLWTLILEYHFTENMPWVWDWPAYRANHARTY